MQCPICKVSPCICGEKYVNLSDFGLISLMLSVYTILKGRKVDIACTINGTSIEDYLHQSDDAPKDTLTNLFLATLNMQKVSPPGIHDKCETYKSEMMKFLEKHKNELVVQLFDKLTEADEKIIAFPLLVLILRSTGHMAKLQYILINMYRETIANVDISNNSHWHILEDIDRMGLTMAVHLDLADLTKIVREFKEVPPVWKAASKAWSVARLIQVVHGVGESTEDVLKTALQCFDQLAVDNDKDNADFWASRFFKNSMVDFGGMVV